MVFVFGDDNIFNDERDWIPILCVESIIVLSHAGELCSCDCAFIWRRKNAQVYSIAGFIGS
jgi:hypothetical protein